MMNMLLRTYDQELQWPKHCSWTRKNIVNMEIELLAKEANYKEHDLK